MPQSPSRPQGTTRHDQRNTTLYSPSFSKLLTQTIIETTYRQLRLQELVGDLPWRYSLHDGTLHFGRRAQDPSHQQQQYIFKASILGTDNGTTFLWATDPIVSKRRKRRKLKSPVASRDESHSPRQSCDSGNAAHVQDIEDVRQRQQMSGDRRSDSQDNALDQISMKDDQSVDDEKIPQPGEQREEISLDNNSNNDEDMVDAVRRNDDTPSRQDPSSTNSSPDPNDNSDIAVQTLIQHSSRPHSPREGPQREDRNPWTTSTTLSTPGQEKLTKTNAPSDKEGSDDREDHPHRTTQEVDPYRAVDSGHNDGNDDEEEEDDDNEEDGNEDDFDDDYDYNDDDNDDWDDNGARGNYNPDDQDDDFNTEDRAIDFRGRSLRVGTGDQKSVSAEEQDSDSKSDDEENQHITHGETEYGTVEGPPRVPPHLAHASHLIRRKGRELGVREFARDFVFTGQSGPYTLHLLAMAAAGALDAPAYFCDYESGIALLLENADQLPNTPERSAEEEAARVITAVAVGTTFVPDQCEEALMAFVQRRQGRIDTLDETHWRIYLAGATPIEVTLGHHQHP